MATILSSFHFCTSKYTTAGNVNGWENTIVAAQNIVMQQIPLRLREYLPPRLAQFLIATMQSGKLLARFLLLLSLSLVSLLSLSRLLSFQSLSQIRYQSVPFHRLPFRFNTASRTCTHCNLSDHTIPPTEAQLSDQNLQKLVSAQEAGSTFMLLTFTGVFRNVSTGVISQTGGCGYYTRH